MPYYGMMGYYGPGYIWVIILWIVCIALVIRLIIWLVHGRRFYRNHARARYAPSEYPQDADDDALQILRRRYARGDISKKEFEQMKDDLEE